MKTESLKNRWLRRIGGESLEPRYLLSALGFVPHEIVSTDADGASSVQAADLDGDGDVDVLSASADDAKIAWYENTDGKGVFGRQQVITTDADGARSVHAADVDGDGDVDVLSASPLDDKIAWYRNDGGGTFGDQQVITTDVGLVRAADLDGDGDVDVLAWSDKIAWYENDGGGMFGEQQVIASTGNSRGVELLQATDMDGDGDVDVLWASRLGDRIAWYENRLAGDVDDDGEVAMSDFVTLASNFGQVDTVWEDGDFDGDDVVQFSDFVVLANNFGKSRQPVVAPTLSSTSQSTEPLPTVNVSAADDLFEQFNDELSLDSLL